MALDFVPDFLTDFGWNDEKVDLFLAIVSLLLFASAICCVMRCLRLSCSDLICVMCFYEICCQPGANDFFPLGGGMIV
ncbi:hypothetical protein TrRE_jg13343 [Triparma retinervis]|uniref:Uncharacterized protein n=1 Tax=Triparma retinervis TaxID=2557542 RepID=A0A9W7DKC0_9STRA|nr:hypothetical protein TrRE_jg13343 [Triparma retinervis]